MWVPSIFIPQVSRRTKFADRAFFAVRFSCFAVGSTVLDEQHVNREIVFYIIKCLERASHGFVSAFFGSEA